MGGGSEGGCDGTGAELSRYSGSSGADGPAWRNSVVTFHISFADVVFADIAIFILEKSSRKV